MKRFCALFCAALLALTAVAAAAEGSWFDSVMEGRRKEKREERKEYVAALTIYGEIDASDYNYDHYGTLDAIDELIEDDLNLGLILLLDTPGGNLYEADELYHALMVYREETGRPIYAYMEQECCSAGVYIAMAAEEIYASRMTLTGSVGVYMEQSNTAGLMEKLGIDVNVIASGDNKVTGPDGMTDEQREIFRAIIDEYFGFFKDAVALARGETLLSDAELLDGRLLTASQALQKGLIDGIYYYADAVDEFYELGRFGDAELLDVTPSWYSSFSSGGFSFTPDLSQIDKEDAEQAAQLLLQLLRQISDEA